MKTPYFLSLIYIIFSKMHFDIVASNIICIYIFPDTCYDSEMFLEVSRPDFNEKLCFLKSLGLVKNRIIFSSLIQLPVNICQQIHHSRYSKKKLVVSIQNTLNILAEVEFTLNDSKYTQKPTQTVFW